jgi:hypothetical protein
VIGGGECVVITFNLDGFNSGRVTPAVLNIMEQHMSELEKNYTRNCYLGGIVEASATIRNR